MVRCIQVALFTAVLLVAADLAVAQPPTPAPTAPLDNTIVNTSTVDLILDFATVEDFYGPDQTNWRFLRRLCGLEPIRRDFYRQYPPGHAPNPVGPSPPLQKCVIDIVGTVAMPAVQVRLSSRKQPYLLYHNDQFLVTITFRGTAWRLNNFTETINVHERDTTMHVLGVSRAYVVPDISSMYTATGKVFLTTDERAELSIAWYVIIISFFALICGVFGVFYLRARRTGDSENSERDPTIESVAKEEEEAFQRAEKRWEETDLEKERSRLMQSAEPERGRSNSMFFEESDAFNQTVMTDNTSSISATIAAKLQASKNRTNLVEHHSRQFNEALDWEPALNLPPESVVVRTAAQAAKIRQENREKAKREKLAAQQRREEAAAKGILQLPEDGTTDLPPEIDEEELERQRFEEEKKKKSMPPMGLAARRMAAMMATLATQKGHSELSSGTLGYMKGSMIAPSRRRNMTFASLNPTASNASFGAQLSAQNSEREMEMSLIDNQQESVLLPDTSLTNPPAIDPLNISPENRPTERPKVSPAPQKAKSPVVRKGSPQPPSTGKAPSKVPVKKLPPPSRAQGTASISPPPPKHEGPIDVSEL